MEEYEEEDEWSDRNAIILRKPKICPTCGKEDLGIGDWLNLIFYKLEERDSFVLKANKQNLPIAERLIRMLSIVGVVVVDRKKEVKKLKYHGYKSKNIKDYITEITIIKFDKMPQIKGLEKLR